MNGLYEKRLKRLQGALDKAPFDTFMVLVDENRRYLSGFTAEDTQFDESAGALIIKGDKRILATDSRYSEQAAKEAPLYEVFCYKEGLVKALPEILRDYKTERLGFESIRMSMMLHQKMADELKSAGLAVELIPSQDIVEDLRVIKEEPEIEAIKKALAIAESVFSRLIHSFGPDITEKAIAWMMEKGMREAGADGLSFPTIAASGPNAALPHAIPGDQPLLNNAPLLFDWGTKLDGYCSDISRTVSIGPADEKLQKVYAAVSEAQQMAITAIRPGIGSREVDRIARAHIAKKGFGENFGHGLGHGVGLAVHEAPRLSPTQDTVLEPGMVFTVEPGIYIPGWGGVRIENMVVVRENGVEVLNRLNTDLLTIGS